MSEETEETALVPEVTKPLVAEPVEEVKDLIVIAQNPGEMQTAQQKLIDWVASKLNELRVELQDYQENLAISKKNKWRTGPLMRAAARTEKRIEFYSKIEIALKEGFCIIPGFPIDTFAIRTTKRNPKRNEVRGWGDMKEQETTALLQAREDMSIPKL